MALFQISEPGESAPSEPQKKQLAVGIDLGTTNSLVATVRENDAETLVDGQGDVLLPSVVRYLGSGQTDVGTSAKNSQLDDIDNTISSVKRLLGRGVGDIKTLGGILPYNFATSDSAVPQIKTVAGNVTAIEVSAEILKSLKNRAENALDGELKGVVITVPAYFDDAQRQATKDAARLADLNVFRLLNEPTAAAIAYGLDQEKVDSLQQQERIIAVYDLGGGTFDISILKLNKGVFEVMATGGDSALGGDDFDHAIAEWMLETAVSEGFFKKENGSYDKALTRRVMIEARRAKEALTDNKEVKLSLENWQATLTKEQFNEMVEPLIKKTLLACRRALRDADLNKEQVHDVVMVGGSTRMPIVREKVGAFFDKPPLINIDPDQVVAIGAALQADVLAGNKPDAEMLLLDVIPLSLGLETYGGLVEKVIARNTTIPITRAQEFTTFKNDQTAMTVHILQGERETVEENRSLAKFALKGIPPMVAGAARIKVTFQVDADGLLNVEAEEETTGVKSNVDVKPSYGLTDNEIEGMIRDSMDNAKVDMEARRLREQIVEAERTLEALDSAMKADAGTMLNDDEIKILSTARGELQKIKDSSDTADEVKQAIKNMEKVAEFYVARRMNDNVKTAMHGQNISDFSDSMNNKSNNELDRKR